MNPTTDQDPLSQLRDIHLPEPGGFWPPAPGWWIVALLVVLAITVTVWLVLRYRRRNAWIRAAEQELLRLEAMPTRDTVWYGQLNQLLKRCARKRYPDRRPETLSGENWVSFLLETSPADRIASRPALESMVRCCWQPDTAADDREVLRICHQWLRGQRC